MNLVRSLLDLAGRRAAVALLAATVAAAPLARAQQENDGVAGGQMVRGTVTAVAADHLSLKTDNGEAYQVAVTVNTRMMKDRQPVKAADVKVGDSIGAMGVLDRPTRTVHAVFVMVVDAEQARKVREALGKSYIAGKVTAIDELRLTILRPDSVSQVIAVDEGTSFRKGGRGMQVMLNGGGPMDGQGPRRGGEDPRGGAEAGGESITLADIKVGDAVAGRGELKNGTFVPAQLAVMDPTAPRPQRRRRPDGSAPEAGAPPAPPQ